MRIILNIFTALIFIFSFSMANEIKFSKEATNDPVLVQEGKGKEFCPVCGMSLKKFHKTSHASHTKDNNATQYCSIRCLLVDHEERGVSLEDAKVIDVTTDKLIQAKKAYYVVGSQVAGTMSKVSKLAFEKESDAKAFIEKMGGEIKTFDETLKIAKDSLVQDDADRKTIMEKKKIPMGEKIYKSKCQTIDPTKYNYVNEMKDDIWKNCKDIDESQAQTITLYLWHKLRFEGENSAKKVTVSQKDRCPVCGMFVYKYPRWASKIYYESKEDYFAFDGVKDMMKFILNPTKYGGPNTKLLKVEVTDYYTQLAIDGKKAFYVLGSDVMGPMGNELIPFAKEEDAKTFKLDHKGIEILKFEDIKSSVLCTLDGIKCE